MRRWSPSHRRSSRCSPSSPTSSPPATSCSSPSGMAFGRIVFRGGDDVFIQSRDLRPLDPLLSRAARGAARNGAADRTAWSTARSSSLRTHGLDFDALQLRLHPAASRVAKLAKETPASFVAFDVLGAGGTRSHGARRRPSAAPCSRSCSRASKPPVHLTPMTRDRAVALRLAGALRRRRSRRRHREAGVGDRTSPASAR